MCQRKRGDKVPAPRRPLSWHRTLIRSPLETCMNRSNAITMSHIRAIILASMPRYSPFHAEVKSEARRWQRVGSIHIAILPKQRPKKTWWVVNNLLKIPIRKVFPRKAWISRTRNRPLNYETNPSCLLMHQKLKIRRLRMLSLAPCLSLTFKVL